MRFRSRGHKPPENDGRVHRYGTVDGVQKSIHAGTRVDIEVDELGQPTAVWFRCLNLPFHVWHRRPGEAQHINPEGMSILNIEYEEVPGD